METTKISQIEVQQNQSTQAESEILNLPKKLEKVLEVSERVSKPNQKRDFGSLEKDLDFLAANSENLNQAFEQTNPDIKFLATSILANYYETKNYFFYNEPFFVEEFSELAKQETEKNLEQLFKYFENEPGYGSEIKLYFIFLEYIENCAPEKRSKFIDLFLRSMETKTPSTDLFFVTKIYLKIFEYGNPEQSDAAVERLLKIAETLVTNEEFPVVMKIIFKVNQNKQTEKVREIMDAFFTHYQLPNAEMSRSWILGIDPENLGSFVSSNITRIVEVEKEHPGACGLLYKQFGIADFARYPKELLVKQAQEINDNTKPYGLIIFPKYDSNGGFCQPQNFTGLTQDLNGEFNLRVAECESKTDIAKLLLKMNKKYNVPGGQKISLLILGGHGSKDSITFGYKGPTQEINTPDLQGMGIKKIGGFFEPSAQIILTSCSTGQEQGIAEEIHKQTGLTTIAPSADISHFIYKANKKPTTGRYEFEVGYVFTQSGGVKKEYKKPKPN